MSGPPYPRVANVYGFDIFDSVISQYANSPIITSMITSFADCIDPAANFDLFYDNVWNILTANGAGLDVWGRILGVSRILAIPDVLDYFGFAEASNVGFGHGPFFSGATTTHNFALSDDAYRLLLLAKAASNITDGSIRSINRTLMNLFPGRGNCFVAEVVDTSDYFRFGEVAGSTGFGLLPFFGGEGRETMQIIYTFDFVLEPYEMEIVQQSGVIPKPTGVKATVKIIATEPFVPLGSLGLTTSDGLTLYVTV